MEFYFSNYFVYFGIFSIYAFIVFFVCFFSFLYFYENVSNAQEKYVILFHSLLLSIFFAPLGMFLIEYFFNLTPPRLNSLSIQEKIINNDINKLATMADNLNRAINNTGELTLNQMHKLVSDAVNLSTEIKKKVGKQQEFISDLLQKVEIEKKKAEESKRIADQIRSITKEQLEAVKFIITEDAKRESNKSFVYGIILSFPIGLITSIFASFLYKRLSKRIRQQNERNFKLNDIGFIDSIPEKDLSNPKKRKMEIDPGY